MVKPSKVESEVVSWFAEVGAIGIHSGRHGAMIENVDEFMVEVFEDIP